MKNEERSYNASSFSFRNERDYLSITTNANQWRKKWQTTIVPSFRFEMNATILLSLLTRINEERNDKQQSFHLFFWDERDYYSITTKANQWRKKFHISRFSFRDERDYPSLKPNANEWRTKLQYIMISSFRFDVNATILHSLLTRMNEERSYKI
jgi:hypothetical protein